MWGRSSKSVAPSPKLGERKQALCPSPVSYRLPSLYLFFLPNSAFRLPNSIHLPRLPAAAFLQQRVGWDGLGKLIREIGTACGAGQCDDPQALDTILLGSLGGTGSGFEDAWQSSWRDQIDGVQRGLDKLFASRSAAALAKDRLAFLETVDSTVPGLVVEQAHWFDDLVAHPIQTVTWANSWA